MLSTTYVSLPGEGGFYGVSGCPSSYFSTTFSASEAGVSSFTATSSNTAAVTVTSPSAAGGVFTVTEVSGLTSTPTTATTITVKDGLGHSAIEQVDFNEVCLD